MTPLLGSVPPRLATWLRVSGACAAETASQVTLLGASVLIVALAVAATIVNAREFDGRYQRYVQRLQWQTKLQLDARPVMGWLLDERVRANRPPALGSLLVRGSERLLPGFVDFAPDGAVWGAEPAPLEHPVVGPRLGLAWLALNPIALLAALLGAHRVVLARRRGTWRALIDLGTQWSLLVTAELSAVVLTLGALWASVLLAAGATVTWLEAAPGALDRIVTILVLLLGPGVLVVALSAGLGAFAACRRRGTISSYLGAVGAWATLVILLPHLTPVAVSLFLESRDRSVMEAERRAAFNTLIRQTEDALGDAVAARSRDSGHTLAHEIDQAQDALKTQWARGAASARRAAADIERQWNARFDEEALWIGRAAAFSPGSIASWMFAELANTGHRVQDEWLKRTSAHQAELNRALFDARPRMTIRPPSGLSREAHGLDLRRPPTLAELPVLRPGRDPVGPDPGLPLVLGLLLAAYVSASWAMTTLAARRLP